MLFTTNNPGETFQFGEKLAKGLVAGDAICLSGDLGAGKTLFVQGIAAGLGVAEGVTSPTFTILQIYDTGRVPIHHFDLYRLDVADQLLDIGFEEYVSSDSVALIEWADKFTTQMPAECLWIELRKGSAAQERVIAISPCGARYRELCEELE
jgi:tRNA threonylcarbamoyladenosine biosynthesis protein TsaE